MSMPTVSDQDRAARENTGWYVYGIVPADVEANPDAHGVGDPPGQVELVRRGQIAAMVSEVRTDRPLGTPQDLMAHQRLLDAAVAVAPVLPLRFGAVLTDREEVAEELLGAHHDEFHAALEELQGVAEYVVKGRYDESTVLAEVLVENPEADRLRREIKGKPEELTRDLRMTLGEMINQAITGKREQDTQSVVEALDRYAKSSTVRDPAHEMDAVHVALLVDTELQGDLEHAVEELSRGWEGRIKLQLLGPLAAYDFVTTVQRKG